MTARDPGGFLKIDARDNSSVQVTINVNSQEANAAQNQASRQIEAMREPEQKRYNRQLMYWQSASRGKSSRSTDKAKIDSISTRALPVDIPDEAIKRQMLAENPFVVGFIVDVELLTIRGNLAGYRVVELHRSFEDVPDDDADA